MLNTGNCIHRYKVFRFFSSIFADSMSLKIFKSVFSWIMLILLLFMAVPAFTQINYEHFLYAGQRDLNKNEYLDAIKKFNIALSSKRDGFEAYFLRGIAKFSLGDFQGAINDFSKTISIHPLYVRAYHYHGISCDRVYDYAHAISDFDKALEIDPFNPEVYMARGDTKMHLNDFHGAIEDYSSAIDFDNKIAAAWLNRGIANHFVGQNEQALDDVNKAIYLDYFNVEAWIKRGMIKYELDSIQEALADYNHAISLEEDRPFVYFQRALTYLKLEDTTATLNDYNKVIELDPDNALTYYNRALIRSLKRQYDSALLDYNKVIGINPYNVYAYFNRGVLYFELEKFMKAEEDFSTAIEIFPDFVGAYVNRSAVREKMKDRRGAAKDHDYAMYLIDLANSDEIDPELLYRKYADSAYFKKIIELEADFLSGNMKKGRIQFQRVPIQPKPNFQLVYAFNLPDSIYKDYQKTEYFDEIISAFNANNKMGIRVVFTTREWPVSREKALDELQRLDSAIRIAGEPSAAFFMRGVVNGMLQNYNIAISAYDQAIEHDNAFSYAFLNRGTTRFELDEFIYSKQEYTNAVTISRSAFNKNKKQKNDPPDHKKTLADYDKVIGLNPRLPFVYYNRANVKLRLKEFHRAIDDYSMAIKMEPAMAEAYYNRALTLLYLKEEKLACKDLSKAGELGITEAYNVIKRYCN